MRRRAAPRIPAGTRRGELWLGPWLFRDSRRTMRGVGTPRAWKGIRGHGGVPGSWERIGAWEESRPRWCFPTGLRLDCRRAREQPMPWQHPLRLMLAMKPCSWVRAVL